VLRMLEHIPYVKDSVKRPLRVEEVEGVLVYFYVFFIFLLDFLQLLFYVLSSICQLLALAFSIHSDFCERRKLWMLGMRPCKVGMTERGLALGAIPRSDVSIPLLSQKCRALLLGLFPPLGVGQPQHREICC
jgi:hypothetical protein